MIELYHWEPNVSFLKPLIVLHEKGLDYSGHYVDELALVMPDIPQANSLELAHNPEGEGPVLVDRGVAMTESFFISLYLDEAYPAGPLRGGDPYQRFQVLAWARFLNEVLAPAVSTLGCATFLVPALRGRDEGRLRAQITRLPTQERRAGWLAAVNSDYPSELLEESRRKIARAISRCEEALAASDWLVGNAYSLSDIDAFSLLYCVPELIPDAFAQAPRTAAWLARIGARPAVQAALKSGRSQTPQRCFVPGPEHSRWG